MKAQSFGLVNMPIKKGVGYGYRLLLGSCGRDQDVGQECLYLHVLREKVVVARMI